MPICVRESPPPRSWKPSTKELHNRIKLYHAEDWMHEEFVVGQKDRSISRTISEGEAMQFNRMVMDLHPYVANERFAGEKWMFGRRLVAGAQVFSHELGLMPNNNIHIFHGGRVR